MSNSSRPNRSRTRNAALVALSLLFTAAGIQTAAADAVENDATYTVWYGEETSADTLPEITGADEPEFDPDAPPLSIPDNYENDPNEETLDADSDTDEYLEYPYEESDPEYDEEYDEDEAEDEDESAQTSPARRTFVGDTGPCKPEFLISATQTQDGGWRCTFRSAVRPENIENADQIFAGQVGQNPYLTINANGDLVNSAGNIVFHANDISGSNATSDGLEWTLTTSQTRSFHEDPSNRSTWYISRFNNPLSGLGSWGLDWIVTWGAQYEYRVSTQTGRPVADSYSGATIWRQPQRSANSTNIQSSTRQSLELESALLALQPLAVESPAFEDAWNGNENSQITFRICTTRGGTNACRPTWLPAVPSEYGNLSHTYMTVTRRPTINGHARASWFKWFPVSVLQYTASAWTWEETFGAPGTVEIPALVGLAQASAVVTTDYIWDLTKLVDNNGPIYLDFPGQIVPLLYTITATPALDIEPRDITVRGSVSIYNPADEQQDIALLLNINGTVGSWFEYPVYVIDAGERLSKPFSLTIPAADWSGQLEIFGVLNGNDLDIDPTAPQISYVPVNNTAILADYSAEIPLANFEGLVLSANGEDISAPPAWSYNNNGNWTTPLGLAVNIQWQAGAWVITYTVDVTVSEYNTEQSFFNSATLSTVPEGPPPVEVIIRTPGTLSGTAALAGGYDIQYYWQIGKSVDNRGPVSVQPGEEFTFNYTLIVSANPGQPSAITAEGILRIFNDSIFETPLTLGAISGLVNDTHLIQFAGVDAETIIAPQETLEIPFAIILPSNVVESARPELAGAFDLVVTRNGENFATYSLSFSDIDRNTSGQTAVLTDHFTNYYSNGNLLTIIPGATLDITAGADTVLPEGVTFTWNPNTNTWVITYSVTLPGPAGYSGEVTWNNLAMVTPDGGETPPPGDETVIIVTPPPPSEETPPPGEETPPPGEETPPPGEETPPPGQETPPPGEETPPPGQETPPPGEETPPPGPQTPPGSPTPPVPPITPPATPPSVPPVLPPTGIVPPPPFIPWVPILPGEPVVPTLPPLIAHPDVPLPVTGPELGDESQNVVPDEPLEFSTEDSDDDNYVPGLATTGGDGDVPRLPDTGTRSDIPRVPTLTLTGANLLPLLAAGVLVAGGAAAVVVNRRATRKDEA